MEYRREIDGLRALAVLPVMLFHAGFNLFGGGYVGVDVFFVISGFLITSIIVNEVQAGNFTISGFYERRARRILPALCMVVLVSTVFGWLLLLPGEMKEFSSSIISVFTFVSNFLFWRTSGYFDTENELKPLLHTWSLAVEEQYYVIFPIFLAACWKIGRRNLVRVMAAVAVLSLLLAQWGSANDPTAAFYLLPTRVWELLLGALTAFYLNGRAEGHVPDRVAELLSLLGLLLIVGAILLFDGDTPFPSFYALVPTMGAVLVISFGSPRTLVGRVLGTKALVGIGLISYSAYLWHQPVFAFARLNSAPDPGRLLMSGLVVASVVAAYFSWKHVELPFRNRRRFDRKKIFGLGLAASVAFIVFGALGVQTNGFSYRVPSSDRALATLQPKQAGEYVSRRFNAHLMKPFDPSAPRKKILVVGDSFAQDLVNVMFEAGLDQGLQFSTRHIGHQCGNLFFPQETLLPFIAKSDMPRCKGRGIYEDEALRRRMQEADEIWFVSRWQSWQAPLVGQSIQRIQAVTGRPARVFGRKDFGKVNLRQVLSLDAPARAALRQPVDRDVMGVNATLRSSLPPTVFVDLQPMACGPQQDVCANFDAQIGLISYDGGHLTQAGAAFIGRKLAALEWVRSLAGAPRHP